MLFRFVNFLLIGLRLIAGQPCDLLRNLNNRVTNAAHAGNLAGNTVRRETGRDENGRRPKPPRGLRSEGLFEARIIAALTRQNQL
jgi:hypothetical protein